MKIVIDDSTKAKLCKEFIENNTIKPEYYDKYNVKRGLRNADGTGVVAGVTNICNVHGYVVNEGEKQPVDGELYYRGYNVTELVKNVIAENRFGYEETVFLLLIGRLPTQDELNLFNKVLGDNRNLPDGFFEDMILKAPSKNIMNKMARSVLALYSYEEWPESMTPEDEMATAISIIAKMPIILVDAYQVKRRTYDGKSMFMHPVRPEETTAQTVLSLLREDRAYTDEEAKLLDIMLMLHAEHGGGNNSTFACRVLTSSGTDPYSAYSAAIGSLKGPRHGGANGKVLEMLDCIMANVNNWDDDGEIADFLAKILKGEANDGSGLIYGMGHAVYTISDPRAVILKENAMRLAKGTEFEGQFKLLEAIERLSPEVYAKVTGKQKIMCANVDLYSGLCYRMLKIPEEAATPLFAVSRMAGWCAHRFEEIVTGKRIIRPAYKSVVKPDKYLPISQR